MSLSGSIQTIQITSQADQARFCAVPDGTPLDPAMLAATDADEHWLLEDAAGAAARCSLWWRVTPAHQGYQRWPDRTLRRRRHAGRIAAPVRQ